MMMGALRWKRMSTPPENEGEGGRKRSGIGEFQLRGKLFERQDQIDEGGKVGAAGHRGSDNEWVRPG